MSKGRSKKVTASKPTQGARIHVHPQDHNPDLSPPVFSLEYLHSDYGLKNCSQAEKAAFADTLDKLSQLSWQKLRQVPRHKLGYEKIPQGIITGAGIPPHITPDVHFVAFRFHKMAPMVGYRGKDERTFYIVYLDRHFTLYDHG